MIPLLYAHIVFLQCLSVLRLISRDRFVALRGKARARISFHRMRRYLAPSPQGKVSLAIAACVKNEAPYIREWIEYHRLQGVERFYLFNNESTDGTRKLLAPYVAEGIVVVSDVPGQGIQVHCFNAALVAYGKFTRWFAYIDCDEFLVPMRGEGQEKGSVDSCERVSDILKDFESHAALAVNWRAFDSNGHEEKPSGLVVENYTRCAGSVNFAPNLHVKCIVDPARTVACRVHNHLYDIGAQAVNENFAPVPYEHSPHTENRLRLNHYVTKSRAEYTVKIARGRVSTGTQSDFLEAALNHPDPVEDRAIFRWLPELREAIRVKGIFENPSILSIPSTPSESENSPTRRGPLSGNTGSALSK